MTRRTATLWLLKLALVLCEVACAGETIPARLGCVGIVGGSGKPKEHALLVRTIHPTRETAEVKDWDEYRTEIFTPTLDYLSKQNGEVYWEVYQPFGFWGHPWEERFFFDKRRAEAYGLNYLVDGFQENARLMSTRCYLAVHTGHLQPDAWEVQSVERSQWKGAMPSMLETMRAAGGETLLKSINEVTEYWAACGVHLVGDASHPRTADQVGVCVGKLYHSATPFDYITEASHEWGQDHWRGHPTWTRYETTFRHRHLEDQDTEKWPSVWEEPRFDALYRFMVVYVPPTAAPPGEHAISRDVYPEKWVRQQARVCAYVHRMAGNCNVVICPTHTCWLHAIKHGVPLTDFLARE